MTNSNIIMGIDPGSLATGYGIVELTNNRPKHIASGTIKMPRKDPLHLRLHTLFNTIQSVLNQHQPNAVAIESLFFAKNIRSVLALAHARGVSLLCASLNNLPVFEYSPLEVKQATVGYGRATKDQVATNLVRFAGIAGMPAETSFDQTDAIAVAICHLYTTRSQHRVTIKKTKSISLVASS